MAGNGLAGATTVYGDTPARKTEVLTSRCTADDLLLIERAAARLGMDESPFVAEAAVQRARRVLETGLIAWIRRHRSQLAITALVLWLVLSLIADLGIIDADHLLRRFGR